MHHLPDNIRRYRKEAKLTQEQLAEVVGVTPGAIYKWEKGLSTPELDIIVQLAQFFDTSVDGLLGCSIQSNTPDAILERVRDTPLAEAVPMLEQALIRYPNHFGLVYTCARSHFLQGVTEHQPQNYQRANDLYKQALVLLPENSDPTIGEQSLIRDMASICTYQGDWDAALQLLKEHNEDHINSARIGSILAEQGKSKEALTHLSHALVMTIIGETFNIIIGYIKAFEAEEHFEDALEAADWLMGMLNTLRSDDKPSYLTKLDAFVLGKSADIALSLNNDSSRQRLKQSIDLMRRFEAEPCFTMRGIRFLKTEGHEQGYDDMNNDLPGLLDSIVTNAHNPEQIKVLWEELTHENK